MSDAALAPIIGVSPAIKRAIALIERFAPTALPILIIGATGTGKELLARHIHYRSGRRGLLVDINCGALPQEMVESLLFGHRRGAFTGAVETVIGHLERANGGTLFLDEVLHLSLSAQVKLLRALETGEVQPLGAERKQKVDFRVVSAAQDDTTERLDQRLFRHDLFQRLAGVVIDLPLLSHRPEDIVPLAEYFAGLRGQKLEDETRMVLQAHAWPGNVRELRLAIERAGCLVENGTLPPGAMRDAIALGFPPSGKSGNSSQRAVAQRAELLAACEAGTWNADRVARLLGVHRATVFRRLKRSGLSLRRQS
ncbi:MAG TPA: sigma 54-interacting transcriptional regulator [Gemmatimonadales bacterium]|nr:sigma 54-interacting transcriptional regulator [Gemmatimonadales bacterium]